MSLLTKAKGFITRLRFPNSCILPQPKVWERILIAPAILQLDTKIKAMHFTDTFELSRWEEALGRIKQINDTAGVDCVNITVIQVTSYAGPPPSGVEVVNAFRHAGFDVLDTRYIKTSSLNDIYTCIQKAFAVPIHVHHQIDVILIIW